MSLDVISALIQVYNVAPATEVTEIIPISQPKRGRGRPRKNPLATQPEKPAKEEKALKQRDNIPLPTKPLTPETAKGFIEAIRAAGKRLNQAGVFTTDPSKITYDQQKAIDAFCGYDYKSVHGLQLDNAMRQARYLMNPVAPDHKRGSHATLNGWVMGMPNPREKKLADLQARAINALKAANLLRCLTSSFINKTEDKAAWLALAEPSVFDPDMYKMLRAKPCIEVSERLANLEMQRYNALKQELDALGLKDIYTPLYEKSYRGEICSLYLNGFLEKYIESFF